MGKWSQRDDHDDDKYVKGDTNWESYDLATLISMVTDQVNIPKLIELADDWRTAGEDVQHAARELGVALDRMMDFWSGQAAEQARTDVALNAEWVSELGDTAYKIGRPVEDAAGALQAAQAQMPELPTVTPAVGSAPRGALQGRDAAGPLGEAIGGVTEGTQSAAQAAEEEARLKRQAVETMRRFETAAMGIDESIPQFAGPGSGQEPKPAPQPPKSPGSELKVVTDISMSWQQLTGGQGAGTSAQNTAERGGGGGGGFGVPAAGGGGLAGTGFAAPATGTVRGTGSGTAAGPMERGPVMPAAASAMPIDPDGHHGPMGGAPMAAGMGAGAGGGTGNDHRRRFPFEADDPFALDEKASPPVIGL
jgi:hypothetical protein